MRPLFCTRLGSLPKSGFIARLPTCSLKRWDHPMMTNTTPRTPLSGSSPEARR